MRFIYIPLVMGAALLAAAVGSQFTDHIGAWITSQFVSSPPPALTKSVASDTAETRKAANEGAARSLASEWGTSATLQSPAADPEQTISAPASQEQAQSQGQAQNTSPQRAPTGSTTRATSVVDEAAAQVKADLIAKSAERAAKEEEARKEREQLAYNTPLPKSRHDVLDRSAPAATEQNPTRSDVSLNDAVASAQPQVRAQNTLDYTTYQEEDSNWINRNALAAGSTIPARLMNDIRSELPGLVKAMVTIDVFDSLTMQTVVIPKGTQLVGRYGSETIAGQGRLYVYWQEARFPNGRVINLDDSGSVDVTGASGLTGRRNGNFLTAVLQGSLIGLAQSAARGGQVQSNTATDLASAARIATGQATASVTEQYLQRSINQGTRFHIKAGTEFNIQLARTFVIPRQNRSDAQRQAPQIQHAAFQSNTGSASALPAKTSRHAYPPYDRDTYGGWSDEDSDCQNTRHEVLEAESEIPVTFKSSKHCTVTRGRWRF